MDFLKGLAGTSGEDGGSYLKIEDGKQVTGLLAGEPEIGHKHFINKRFTECVGDQCPHCKEGLRPSFKFKINIIMHENHALVPKIFEGGWKVYQQLGALQQAGYDLTSTPVMIGRQGKGTNTVFTVMPSPKGALKPEVQAQFKAVKLLSLERKPKSDSPPKIFNEEPTNDANEDLPF